MPSSGEASGSTVNSRNDRPEETSADVDAPRRRRFLPNAGLERQMEPQPKREPTPEPVPEPEEPAPVAEEPAEAQPEPTTGDEQ